MSEHRIRYIIGAGASANAIATVKNFNTLFYKWADYMDQYHAPSEEDKELMKLLRGTLRDVGDRVGETFSIDTYARMLWLRKDDLGLKKLKALMTLILNLEQFSNPSDIRYDIFLSSLLQTNGDKISFPKNIQIVSWNYDFQFELALAKILGKHLKDINTKEFFGSSGFVKLNGSVLCERSFDESNKKEEYDYLKKVYNNWPLILKAKDIISSGKGSLGEVCFSWEGVVDFRKMLSSFIPTVTVVVGYSFPTFNRNVDLGLIQTDSVNQKDPVYIQCNSSNTTWGNEEVRSKLLGMGIQEHRIKDVSNSTEFLVPYEFNVSPKRFAPIVSFR